MTVWTDIATAISQASGQHFEIRQQASVGGGCINTTYRIHGGDGQGYFVKLNSASLLEMFVAESEGLQEMARAGAVRVPQPLCYGCSGNQAYLVIEDLALGGGAKPGAMGRFGEQLAAMHHYTQPRFGWHRDNTIGSTPQPNDWHANWLDFWREQRLGFQLRLAQRNGASHRLLDMGQRLQQQLQVFFTDYQPPASCLHGDLWSGNYAISDEGEAVIFDPAVYFGDREADLAMTELFGGFGGEFYAAYNHAWPLDSGYAVRKTLYNLYHIINHFNLFGGGYAAQAESMVERLLAETG